MNRQKNKLSKDEIRDILELRYNKVYGGQKMNRELLISESKNCIFLALDGTPPKGYGIYVPENKALHLFELDGKKFMEYSLQEGIIGIDD